MQGLSRKFVATKATLPENSWPKATTSAYPSQKEKYRYLQELENAASHLEIVTMDAQRDLPDPTVMDTENSLKAAGEIASLKKVVFVVLVAPLHTPYPDRGTGDVYTEADEPHHNAATQGLGLQFQPAHVPLNGWA